MSNPDRREYTRLVVDIGAGLYRSDGARHIGRVRDISFAGAYLEDSGESTPSRLPLHGCTLALQLPGHDDPVRLRCSVVDWQARRLGICFVLAEEADFIALRAFLVSQSSDPAGLIRELHDMPNPAFAPPLRLPRFGAWLAQMMGRTGPAGP